MTYVHRNCNVLIVVGLGHYIEYYQVSLPVIAGVRVGNDVYYPNPWYRYATLGRLILS